MVRSYTSSSPDSLHHHEYQRTWVLQSTLAHLNCLLRAEPAILDIIASYAVAILFLSSEFFSPSPTIRTSPRMSTDA